jgi:hypothetical protein
MSFGDGAGNTRQHHKHARASSRQMQSPCNVSKHAHVGGAGCEREWSPCRLWWVIPHFDDTQHLQYTRCQGLVTLCSVFPSLCVPSVSAGNLATSPVPGTVSRYQGPVAITFLPPKEAGTSRALSQHPLHSHIRQAHQLKTPHQHCLRPGKPGW